jgi:hypothetical protein
MNATANLIKLNITPEQVWESLPADFGVKKPEEGFSDKELLVSLSEGDITFIISYDGESELIASSWESGNRIISIEKATSALEQYFEM